MIAVRALLLDLDGTVAPTLPAVIRAVREAVRPFRPGLPEPTDDQIAATFGPVERGTIAAFVAPADVDAALNCYFTEYERLLPGIRPFPGIPEVLLRARALGIATGLATGRGRRGTETTLSSLGLRGAFESVVTGDDVTRPKPDPEPIRRALRELRSPACGGLYVGDTPADVLAARAAGSSSGAALWGSRTRDALLAALPDFRFESPAELYQLLGEG